MQAKTQFVNKLWRNSNSKGCTNFIFHLRTQCCVSISQLCWCQCKHIIHLPPADCTDCSQFFFPPSARRLSADCLSPAVLQHGVIMEWSAGTRTAGYYSVFRCTASYQHTGLTEAAALVNMPTPECSPWGCWEGGVDRIWRDHSKLFPKKIKYTSQNIFRTTRWRTLESARVIIPAHFTQHHHAPLDLTRGGCQRGGRGGGVWQVTAAEWGWQSLVALNTKKMSI